VNAYLRAAAGDNFSAKDVRTWYGTLLAARALGELAAGGTPTKKNVVAAIAAVASRLGNTPSVCRRCYVHPAIVSRYLEGRLERLPAGRPNEPATDGLSDEETALLGLLREDLSSSTEDLASKLAASQRLVGRRRGRAAHPSARAAA
jgi:DNA topoisomerase I